MIRKMIAAVAMAAGIALLAPSAAVADDAFYDGPVYPGSRVCVDAWGTSAYAWGGSDTPVEFIVRVRRDGSSTFNFLDSSFGYALNGSYYVAGGGTFRLCARTVNFTPAQVSLLLSTS